MTLLEKLNELLEQKATAEEIQSSLGEFMIPKGTFNKVNEENKALKSKSSALEGELSTAKDEVERIKVANMDEQQLLQHKLEKAETIITEHALKTNRLSAENEFISAGFEKEEYQDLLEQVVSDDSERTQTLVDGFIKLAGNRAKKAKEEENNRLLGESNKLPEGDKPGSTGEVTLEQFQGFTFMERTELFNSDRELYNTLNEKAKA